MSMEWSAAILFGGLIILLVIGVEIFAAVGLMAFIGLVFLVDQPIIEFSYSAFNTMNSWVLAAIPLFIFMGAIFSDTGIVRRLFDAADKWLRMLPGGLISTVIGVNGLQPPASPGGACRRRIAQRCHTAQPGVAGLWGMDTDIGAATLRRGDCPRVDADVSVYAHCCSEGKAKPVSGAKTPGQHLA